MAQYIDDITGPFVSLKAIFYKRLSYWDTMRDLSAIYPNIVESQTTRWGTQLCG